MPTAPNNGQFGPNTFFVRTRSQVNQNLPGTVAARYLQNSAGDYVLDPRNNLPYIVPADYDPARVVQQFQRLAATELQNAPATVDVDPFLYAREQLWNDFGQMFPSGAPSDLQRSYNGTVGNEFVPDFTPAASFNLGLAAAAAGLSATETFVGGEVYSILTRLRGSNVDTSGYLGNTEINVPHITDGFQQFFGGTFSSPSASLSGVTLAGNTTPDGYNYTEQLQEGRSVSLRYDASGGLSSETSVGSSGPNWSETSNPDGSQSFTYNGQQYSGPTLASSAGLTLGSTIGAFWAAIRLPDELPEQPCSARSARASAAFGAAADSARRCSATAA